MGHVETYWLTLRSKCLCFVDSRKAHSVRGFISTAGKKHSVKIESLKNEAGDRLYRIAK